MFIRSLCSARDSAVDTGDSVVMDIPDHLTCLLRNLYGGQEAIVRTGHRTTDWFQIREGVCQGHIGEGSGTPLQYSFLENPMDRGAW